MPLSKSLIATLTLIAFQGGLLSIAKAQHSETHVTSETVTETTPDITQDIVQEPAPESHKDGITETQLDTLKNTTSLAKRANKIRKGDAAAIASTAVTAITGDSVEGQAINENIKKANTMRKIATGNVGSLAKVLMKSNRENASTGPSLKKLKKRAAKTTGLKSRNLIISDVKAGDPRTVYKATTETGLSYWCFVSFDGKKTSDAICSESGGDVCSPTRKDAGEC